jgi:L-asparagine transporter-like permease
LDIPYVNCFFIPPVAIATAATMVLARRLEWSGPAWLLAYLLAVVISLVLWLAGLVMWSRRQTGSSSASNSEPE